MEVIGLGLNNGLQLREGHWRGIWRTEFLIATVRPWARVSQEIGREMRYRLSHSSKPLTPKPDKKRRLAGSEENESE